MRIARMFALIAFTIITKNLYMLKTIQFVLEMTVIWNINTPMSFVYRSRSTLMEKCRDGRVVKTTG